MAETSYKHWTIEKDQAGHAWLTLDRKDSPVNTLNRAVLEEFESILDAFKKQTPSGVVIQSAKSSGFIAGADIEEFTQLKTKKQAFELVRRAQKIFDKLQALTCPTVALIDGFCLGGGFELALACRYRIATETSKVGLPEIKLGIHPGWGGTVRAVQLVGVFKAMSMILPGAVWPAKKAKKVGFIDAAIPERMLKRAAEYYLEHRPREHEPHLWEVLASAKMLRPLISEIFYKQLNKKVSKKHYPAPFAVVKNWVRDGATGSAAQVHEAKSISELFLSKTSQNLVRVFFLQTRMKGLAKDVNFNCKHVHVIGAGVMGGDIAAWCAFKGMTVTLQDREPKYIAPAIKRAHKLYMKKYRGNQREIGLALDRLMPDVHGHGVQHADVVIEAIYENLDAKHALYKELEPKMKKGAVLATNTSTLPLEELNKALKHPERLVGIHFFNPVAMMQLVEVVSHKTNDKDTVQHALSFVRQIDRLPLPVKSSPGFLVNRVLLPYLMESVKLLEEGVPATVIDKAAKEFGMPMGPIELADTVGLDICLHAGEILTQHLGGEIPDKLRQMVEKKQLGKKTGKGFYTYKKGKKQTQTIPVDVNAPNDLVDRLVMRLLNEAMACVRENIVPDQELCDAGMIFGTGFAPFTGGPMHYAETKSHKEVIKKLKALQKSHGDRFKPDKGWEE